MADLEGYARLACLMFEEELIEKSQTTLGSQKSIANNFHFAAKKLYEVTRPLT